MDFYLLLSFIIVSIGLIIIPGPNVVIIVSTSLHYGIKRGLFTVTGTSLAMIIQLLIAGIATTWFIQLMADGFLILKWLGIIYLFYLGIAHLRFIFINKKSDIILSKSMSFSRGFLVSLTNPKTILFFGAFLPQFVSSYNNYGIQIFILSLTFLILAIILDSSYAILAVKLKQLVKSNKQKQYTRLQNSFSALLYIVASGWLAVSGKAQ